MATFKQYGLSGLSTDVEFGKQGLHLKSDGSVFGAYQADGTTLTEVYVAEPTVDDAATTKKYVDDQILQYVQGLDVKASVRVATTGNITLSGTQIIDGVSLAEGDRVLVKDQTDAKENGIYVVGAAAWSRAEDADNSPDNEVSGGMFMFVEEGNVAADTGWVLTSPDGVASLGSDELSFSQFSGAGSYTGTNGVNINGVEVSADVDGTTLTNDGGTGGQLAVYGGTAGQVMMSTGSSDAEWGFVSELRDGGDPQNVVIVVSSNPGGENVGHLTVDSGDTTSGAVQVGVTGTAAGGSNLDLELSAAGSGLIVAPSGYDMSAGADSAFTTKGFVEDFVNTQIEAGAFKIEDGDADTYVRTESAADADEDYVAIGSVGNDVLVVGKPTDPTDAGSTTVQSGTNRLITYSVSDTSEETRIEAAGSAADIDIRLIPKGAGQVFIGDTGAGVIQADDNYSLSLLGGDGAGSDAGDVIVAGGAGEAGQASGNVLLYGGTGGDTEGVVQIQDSGNNDVMVFETGTGTINSHWIAKNGEGEVRFETNSGSNADMVLAPDGTGLVTAFSGYDMSAGPGYAFVTKDYVDTQISSYDLNVSDGTTSESIDIGSETLTIQGTADEVDVVFDGTQTFTVGLPDSVTITNGLTVSAGGVTVTGDSTVEGNLDVNGTLEANDTFTLVDDAADGEVTIGASGTGPDIDVVIAPTGAGVVTAPSGYDMSGGGDSAFTTKGYVETVIGTSTDELTLRSVVTTAGAATVGTVPDVSGKDYFPARVIVTVTTPLASSTGTTVSNGVVTLADEATDYDLTVAGTYIIEQDWTTGSTIDGSTITVSDPGVAGNFTVVVEYKAVTA